jgi:hypothetical protein
MKNHILLLLLFLILISCSPTTLVPVDIPDQKYSLVMNAFVVKDSFITGSLMQSKGILQKWVEMELPKANINIRINQQEVISNIDTVKHKHKFVSYFNPFDISDKCYFNFKSASVIKNNDVFEINGSYEGMASISINGALNIDDVQAELVPNSIDSILDYKSFELNIIKNSNINYAYSVQAYVLKDDGIYYPLLITNVKPNTNGGGIIDNPKIDEVLSLNQEEVVFNGSYFRIGNNKRKFYIQKPFIFSNEIIGYDTTYYPDSTIIISPIYQDRSNENFTNKKIKIKVSLYSEDYFKFMKTLLIQLQSRNDLFAEPTQVYSNQSDYKSNVFYSSKKLLDFE